MSPGSDATLWMKPGKGGGMMVGFTKTGEELLCREATYLMRVRAAASREMRRELFMLRALGYPKHLAGLSERFVDAFDAKRSACAMEIRLPGP